MVLFFYVLNCIIIAIYIKKFIFIKKNRIYYSFKIILFPVFIILNLLLFYGAFPDEKPFELTFPLKNGYYYVYQGGKSPFYNILHSKNPWNKYSMDIVKMNKFGFAVKKLLNDEFLNHEIYNEIVYSPCGGKVVTIVNNKNDGINKNETGKINNCVIIKYENYLIALAHIKKDSFFVKEGDVIKKGDKLGLAGSAGCRLPHLHIQVMKNKTSMPFTFNNKFYYDNCIIKAQ